MTTATSDVLEQALMNKIFNGTAYSPPSPVYAALYTTAGTGLVGLEASDHAAAAEVATGLGYTRLAVTFATASGGSTNNSTAAVTFGPCTAAGGWGTMGYVALCTSAAYLGGSVMWYGALSDQTKIVALNDYFKFNIGQLIVNMDSADLGSNDKASDYLSNWILDRALKSVADKTLNTKHIALFTGSSSPTLLEAGTLTGEVSGGSYARVAVTDANWSAPASSIGGFESHNLPIITFPTASASWGTVTYAAVMDASTAGNVLFWDSLTTARLVGIGESFSIAVGDCQFIMK